VHCNTIGAWERGDRLPDTRGTVLELAKCLHLDEQETARLLEASLTGVSTRWNVPYRRNPFFTGREELMQRLHTLLRQEKAAALTQSLVLSGLGGIGKTQTAVEYAYRYAQQYASIFWLNADTMEGILSSYATLAALLELQEQQEPDQQKVVAAVNRWLSTHRDWLLIVDNVEEREMVASVLPTSPEGSLLFTTRRQSLGTLAYPLEVERMSQEEGTRFLLYRSRRLSLDEPLDACSFADVMEAGKIVAEMEGLPLALDQAGAYIEETQCTLQDYLQLFQAHRATLLQQRGREGADHPDSVATTLSLSIAALAQQHPAAVDLLRVCALLHSDGIPEELFLEAGSHLGPTLAAACADVLSWNRLIASVSAYSLIKRQAKEKTLSMHRLVQAVLQDDMEEADRRGWMEHIIVALNKLFPEAEQINHTCWEQCSRLLLHVLGCVEKMNFWQPENMELASVLSKAAMYLFDRAQYAEAEPLYQRSWHLWEQILGPAHSQVAYPLNGLAKLYLQQGKYEQAEMFYLRALYIREYTLGSEDPEVASLLNGLAVVYQEQGKYEQAEALFQQAWHIWEKSLGPEDPKVSHAINNLGGLYREQGKYEEAEPLFWRALHIREKILGPEHPQVAYSLDSLPTLYYHQGKYEEAEPLRWRALHIREKALGPEHSQVAYSLHGLATLYKEQGRYEQAKLFNQRALHIWERTLGSNHGNVAVILNNIAESDSSQGKYEEAEPLYQQALYIWEQALGPEHPMVAHALHGLAFLYFKQGKYAEAEPLFERALALRERHLEARHRDIADVLHDFAAFRKAQGRTKEAATLYQRALAIREHVFGHDHMLTRETRESYAALLREMGRQEEADALETGRSKEMEAQ